MSVLFNYNDIFIRCNDVLELVETTRHFQLLAATAEIGGAGARSLDAMVTEIQQTFFTVEQEFFSQVDDVLDVNSNQAFDKAFFTFRLNIKVRCARSCFLLQFQ